MGISFNADEVFEMGMDIEQNGEAYHRKAAELTEDPEIKKIFDDLMTAEQQHYELTGEMWTVLETKTMGRLSAVTAAPGVCPA